MTAKPKPRPARPPKSGPAPRPDANRVIRAFVRTLERIEGARKPGDAR